MTKAAQNGGHEESTFRLLVPSNDTASSEAVAMEAAGQRWRVVGLGAVPIPSQAPEYMCISYSWGEQRIANPFDSQRPMSVRVQPILETAIASSRPVAIWLDAACMPSQERARDLCLQNMGAIYAAASGVLAVLSPAVSVLLDKVRRNEAIGLEELKLLEADEWVSRVWTYQEMVNSKTISFIAEGETCDPVSGSQLLNAVGYAMMQYGKAEQIDAYEFRQRYPRLDALETLTVDWLRADYSERSAYQVMNAMVGRTYVYPRDYFYAMIGAITAIPSSDTSGDATSPPESFMQVCEQKGDFSFIYSRDPRASDDARGWRPSPVLLLPILPWLSDGERQTGELHLTSLRLHNMARLALGQLEEAARVFIHDWLKAAHGPSSANIGDAVRETLHRIGFTGCGEYLETRHGLFFPQHPLVDAADCIVFVATEISFNFGAPGLLLNPTASGITEFRDVGVYCGLVPEMKETVIIK